ncbi:MAG: LLM class flavin-dependent oxidoreductase [Steroidobacteraceae bacterium]
MSTDPMGQPAESSCAPPCAHDFHGAVRAQCGQLRDSALGAQRGRWHSRSTPAEGRILHIQLILDPHLPPQRLAELGALAERHGIDAVWTSSLLGCRDPFLSFVPLAQATRRIRLGPIAVNPFDTHPARIAMALLTLNELAGGRAQVVIGGGGEALEGLGLAPRRRVRAVHECIELLRTAASGVRGDYAGEIFRTRGFACTWASASPPPLWIGANGPQMLAMAAKHADGIMLSDLPAGLAATAIARASAVRSAQGGSRALMFSNFTAWHVYDDAARAREEARRWLAYRGLFRRWVCTTFISDAEYDLLEARTAVFYRWAQGGPAVEDLPPGLLDRLVDHLTLTGTPGRLEPVLQHLEDQRRAGLTHIALRLYQDVERSIELIGREVVPRFA